MQRFDSSQLETFLVAVDDALATTATITVIARVGLDRDVLLARFEDLLAEYVGDPAEPRWALFHFVEEVWGELVALPLRPLAR